MDRRLFRLLCSLWLLAGSLLPGSGWALCVSASGHVALEVTAPAHATVAADNVCRDECPPERCEDCHDVRLESPDRTCPRRDVSTSEIALAPANVALPGGLPVAVPVLVRASAAWRTLSAPHLVHVLRC